MQQITTIGFDLAKQVFQVHGAEADGSPVVSRKLRRADVLAFFETLSPCTFGMQTCGGANYWTREIAKVGHGVRFVPPSYVKPFVKRGTIGWEITALGSMWFAIPSLQGTANLCS